MQDQKSRGSVTMVVIGIGIVALGGTVSIFEMDGLGGVLAWIGGGIFSLGVLIEFFSFSSNLDAIRDLLEKR